MLGHLQDWNCLPLDGAVAKEGVILKHLHHLEEGGRAEAREGARAEAQEGAGAEAVVGAGAQA